MYTSDTNEDKKRRRKSGRGYGRDYDSNHEFAECREAIISAFKKLRSQNIRTRANFLCCGSCASSAISILDEGREKKGQRPYDGAVFWHHQSEAGLRESGDICIYFCVAGKLDRKGNDKDPKDTTRRCKALGEKLVAALKDEDLEVDWDGDTNKAVIVDGFTPKYWQEKSDKAEFKENIRESYGIRMGSGL
jgi:hypothetical protein